MEVVLDRYERCLKEEKGNKEASVNSTMIRLKNLMDVAMIIADVSARQLQKRYIERCEKVAVDTHRNELMEVKTFWRWCVKKKLITSSPAANIEPVGKRRKGEKAAPP